MISVFVGVGSLQEETNPTSWPDTLSLFLPLTAAQCLEEALLHTVIQGPALLPGETPPSAGLSNSSSFCSRMGKMVVDLTWKIFMGHV